MAPSAESPPAQQDSNDSVQLPPNMILPPPEMRVNVDKVADYVGRNGPAFEARLYNNNKANSKFTFLRPEDPFRPFYEWRLEEAKQGRLKDSKILSKTSIPVPEKPKGPEPPPDFHFSVRMPNINAQDLDVIRLTALFVAKNGRSFMTSLSQKEVSNFQFDFLRPQHSLYQYFSRLIDQYTLLLKDEDGEQKKKMDHLSSNLSDKFTPIGRAKQRAEWLKYQEKQKTEKNEAAEAEKIAYAQIDWHDLVVLDTVMFVDTDNDNPEIYAAPSLSDVQTQSLEQRATSFVSSNRRIEETMPGEEIWNGPRPTSQPYQPAPAFVPPPGPLPPRPSMSPAVPHDGQFVSPPTAPLGVPDTDRTASPAQAGGRASSNRPMNIRTDYVPRAQVNRRAQTAQCPNCKLQIPVEEMAEHLRIEMLDPQWKEQRARADARHATTNLSHADMANNLKRLASQRTDVFDGVTGEQISEDEAARRKRAQTSYDGVIMGEGPHRDPNSAQAQTRMQQMSDMTINEQIRQIHRKAQGDNPQQ